MCVEHTKFKHKKSYRTSSSNKSKSEAHHIHGKSKYPRHSNPFDKVDLIIPYEGQPEMINVIDGEWGTEEVTSFCDDSGRPPFTWDYDNNDYNIDVAPFRKIKAVWDSLDIPLKVKSFEDIGNHKQFFDYIASISSGCASLQQFAMACVYYTKHFNRDGADIDVAIKRLKRRGHTNKFISNRTHVQKYAY